MKLKITGFEEKINFDTEKINVLEINNLKLFTKVLENINYKINGIESNVIYLYNDDYEEIDMSKEMYIIFDIFNIEYNSKKFLTKIYDIISQNIKKEQDTKFNNIALELRNYLITEINELPFEFVINDEVDVTQALKLINLRIDEMFYTTVLERIEFIIDLMVILKVGSILVIPNLNSYLEKEELIELYKYSLYNNIKLLIIEKELTREKIEYENIYKIDSEFDEIRY